LFGRTANGAINARRTTKAQQENMRAIASTSQSGSEKKSVPRVNLLPVYLTRQAFLISADFSGAERTGGAAVGRGQHSAMSWARAVGWPLTATSGTRSSRIFPNLQLRALSKTDTLQNIDLKAPALKSGLSVARRYPIAVAART
jgi:hypothetical protein